MMIQPRRTHPLRCRRLHTKSMYLVTFDLLMDATCNTVFPPYTHRALYLSCVVRGRGRGVLLRT